MQKLRDLYVFIGFLVAVALVAIGHFVFHIPEGFGRLGLFFGAVTLGALVGSLLAPRNSHE